MAALSEWVRGRSFEVFDQQVHPDEEPPNMDAFVTPDPPFDTPPEENTMHGDRTAEHTAKAEALIEEAGPTMHLGSAQLLTQQAQAHAFLAMAAAIDNLAEATRNAGRGRR